MDKLDRLRCLSRASISSCSGSEPWESKYNESFDYDVSGNRTNRRYGAFNTDDDDGYTYVSGPTDIIDKVTSRGTDKQMSNDFKGEITDVNQPNAIQFAYNYEGRVTSTNDSALGSAVHKYSYYGDRYLKVSPCNARETHFLYRPLGEGGASPEVNFIDAYGTCADEFPREYRGFVYLDGKPLAVVHSTMSSGGTQTETGTFWMHADQLGTPVLVTNSSKVERWRWENDPFGRERPIEYTVSSSDVNPDDDSSSGGPPPVYNTCCCTSCGVSGCGAGTTGCSAGCCAGSKSQASVWTKTYSPGSANNVRVHFSSFDVKAGSTRTGKDYVEVINGASSVVATLTGDLGDFWGPWSGDGTATVKLYADNVADGTRGVVVDKLEYTTSTNGKFVMWLRMPGQIWEAEANTSYNYQRWYRPEDGRYVSPDPIGLDGGEAGYSAYVNSNPLAAVDPRGLSVNLPQCELCGRETPLTQAQAMRLTGLGTPDLLRVCDTCVDPMNPDAWFATRFLCGQGQPLPPQLVNSTPQCARCKCQAAVNQQNWTHQCRASCGLDAIAVPHGIPLDLFGTETPNTNGSSVDVTIRARDRRFQVCNSPTCLLGRNVVDQVPSMRTR